MKMFKPASYKPVQWVLSSIMRKGLGTRQSLGFGRCRCSNI